MQLRLNQSIILCLIALSACHPEPPPSYKIGKPYTVDGQTYFPEANLNYDKIGDGSWYGPGFDGRRTASGEIFDQDDLTAAHPTLPMPSLVRVTNLKNDKSIIVRINDRGPFKKNRIIDLSKGAAQAIGLHSTMPVRVQYLPEETEAYIAEMNAQGKHLDMQAINERAQGKNIVETASAPQPESVQIFESAEAATSNEGVTSVAPLTSIQSNDLGTPEKPASAPAPRKNLWKDPESSSIQVADTKPVPSAKPAAKVAPEEEPAAKPVSKAPTAQESSGKGKYTIFAGSFASEENAKKLAQKLKGVSSLKIPVTMDKATVDGKTWWRVHAGPFSQETSAEQALEIVQNSGSPTARISKQ